jgi:cell division transport system permease protein
MNRKRFQLGYFIREGFHSIFSHGLMSFAAICMIVACLIIMGSFSLIAVNADKMLGTLEAENEFLAYIDESYTDQQIEDLISRVKRQVNVASVRFVSREEAKAAYLEGQNLDGLYTNLPDEVFRDRLAIRVVDISQFNETVETVANMKGVVNYRAESDLAEGFVTVRNVASALATILIVILAAVSLFIIANTIRLATFARREEIAIMKMCGATNGFVRWPFVIEGLLLGLFGAIVAFFLQWLIYVLLYRAVVESGAITLFTLVAFETMWGRVLSTFLLGGALIGACGSGFAIRRFLQV